MKKRVWTASLMALGLYAALTSAQSLSSMSRSGSTSRVTQSNISLSNVRPSRMSYSDVRPSNIRLSELSVSRDASSEFRESANTMSEMRESASTTSDMRASLSRPTWGKDPVEEYYQSYRDKEEGNEPEDEPSPLSAWQRGTVSVGDTMATLPPAYSTIEHAGRTYFLYDNLYLTETKVGNEIAYAVVSAPLGMFVHSLPFGHYKQTFAATDFYVLGDITYIKDETRGGYIVVERPAELDEVPKSPYD